MTEQEQAWEGSAEGKLDTDTDADTGSTRVLVWIFLRWRLQHVSIPQIAATPLRHVRNVMENENDK